VARSRHRADDHPQRAADAHREPRVNANGNGRRLLVGVCAGLACWGAWRSQQSRLSRQEHGETAGPAFSGQSEPTAPRL
jgi:hypothetical protein